MRKPLSLSMTAKSPLFLHVDTTLVNGIFVHVNKYVNFLCVHKTSDVEKKLNIIASTYMFFYFIC